MPDTPESPPTPSIQGLPPLQYLLLLPATLLLYLWHATLRLRPTAAFLAAAQDSRPRVILLWHNRLFFTPLIRRRYARHRTVAGFISTSKDGAWLAALYKLNGFLTIRGSSSRRGSQALLEAHHHLRQGHDIALTPDGPRGPRYTIKPGAAHLAEKSDCPLLLLAVQPRRAKALRSWDAFLLPLPFTRVHLDARLYENLEALLQQHPAASGTEALRLAMLALSEAPHPCS